MLLARIQRAQAQLRSHQTWLRLFIASQSFSVTQSRQISIIPYVPRYIAVRKKHRPTSKSKSKPFRPRSEKVIADALCTREALLAAIAKQDFKAASSLYNRLPEKKPLNHKDVRALTNSVLQCLRLERYNVENATKDKERQMSGDNVDLLAAFASQLAADIRNERLVLSSESCVHILAVHKESGHVGAGIEFWQWLRARDDTPHQVYAVGIELLAADGLPLQELELVYQEALALEPGGFASYHFAPEAFFCATGTQRVPIRLPWSLLKSITQARILRGDSRNAYLALEKNFLISPLDVHPKMLLLFLRGRPVSEFYAIASMSCRAGIPLPRNRMNEVRSKIRDSMPKSLGDDLTHYIPGLRALAAMTYLHLRSIGSSKEELVDHLVITTSQVFHLPQVASLDDSSRRRLSHAVQDTIRLLVDVFCRHSPMPTPRAWSCIIALVAGHGSSKEVMDTVLADMQSLGLRPDHVTRRCILTAFGSLKDADAVVEAWRAIVAAHASEGNLPENYDFNVLAYAASRIDSMQLCRAELDQLQHRMPPARYNELVLSTEKRFAETATASTSEPIVSNPAVVGDILSGLETLRADLAWMKKRLHNPTDLPPHYEDIPRHIVPPDSTIAMSERELIKLYKELNIEPSTVPTEADSTESFTEPLDRQRYEHWKSINYLLWLAERHDREHAEAVNKATAQGEEPPSRNLLLTKQELEEMKTMSLNSMDESGSHNQETFTEEQVQKARAEILRLRGRA